MAMINTQIEDASETAATQDASFPAPFTAEEFHRDVLMLYVHQMRTMAWMKGDSSIWQVFGEAPEHPDDIFGPEITVEEMKITYAAIADTSFAKCLESMYLYSYSGILDESFEPMEYETNYTMLSAILCDMNKSLFMSEWDSYVGCEEIAAAQRCLAVAELANARRVLEGHENFSYFFGANSKEDDATSLDGGLSIRQMALLAGMEEMSIRAAANPKRANPLPTYSDEEKRTRIAIEAAKAWLQAKGRYVPVTRRWGSGDIDLAKRKFSSLADLRRVIHDRPFFLEPDEQRSEELANQIKDLGIKCGVTKFDAPSLSDTDFVRGLAKLLEFPADLFALRVREVLAKEELAAVERALRDIAQQSD